MIHYDPSRGLDAQLRALQDTPDRIATVLIALANGDQEGAQTVMAGADMAMYVHVLQNLCIDLGQRLYGDRFATRLRSWAEKVRALDPHDPRTE